MKILIAVTHLLGTGHLRRAINLSQAFVAAGHRVTLVSGGLPVPAFDTSGISLAQLPALHSDGTNFTRLLAEDGTVASTGYLESRCRVLKEIVEANKPSVVITELFPFGRRVLSEEFLVLLEAAHSLARKPVILASVRDILATPSSAEKALKTEVLIERYYDAVVVHSIRDSTPLNASWPVSTGLEKKLFYSGYVAQHTENPNPGLSVTAGDIIVSAGGGSVGRQVYETAIGASRLSSQLSTGCRWHILVGGSDAESEVVRLKNLASGTPTIIEPNRPDFRQLLQQARCSVSMCGYNTAVDLLLTGTPGVLIPFDADGETEQTIRARSLARQPYFSLLSGKDLSARNLYDAVVPLASAGRFKIDLNQFNGAVETVGFATKLAQCT
ncbi:hypothetical protein AB833_21305 [Chromatiales bacterium (ex Bugula neritina AB1)]|nr:hypothetical protein AB833_21305 [Chromatiales bacterium (ex Bugula neritina AB1)]